MNKNTNILLGVIVVLVTINLGFTAVMYNRQTVGLPADDGVTERLDSGIARTWGDKVARLYNRQDHEALYALFNQQARVKISGEQLATQLVNLHRLFGDIEDQAFVNSVKVGAKGEALYHQLFFNVRVSENSNPATMKLSLVVENELVSIYGLRINASHSLD